MIHKQCNPCAEEILNVFQFVVQCSISLKKGYPTSSLKFVRYGFHVRLEARAQIRRVKTSQIRREHSKDLRVVHWGRLPLTFSFIIAVELV